MPIRSTTEAGRKPHRGGCAARALLVVFAVLTGLWIAFRVPHEPFRGPVEGAEPVVETSIRDLVRDAGLRQSAQAACVERHSDGGTERFSLGFVEFDDQGAFWSRDQLAVLEDELERAGELPGYDGVLTVVFVHGWQHNASVCDQNVACFRDMLEALVNAENYRVLALRNEAATAEEAAAIRPRYVFGVYVGWRGLSNSLAGLQLTSFYDRKAAAHRVGGGEVIELFTRLEVMRDRWNAAGAGSKLVVLGHSFGGAVTYTAVSRVLHERLARAVAEGRTGPSAVRGFGDLVVLVNPAFEASVYRGIRDLATEMGEFDPLQPAVLLTVSSSSDTATNLAFPVGRFLATRFLNTRDGEQSGSLISTIGNFVPYRSHTLMPLSDEELRGLARLGDLDERDATTRGRDDCRCDYFETDVKAARDDPFGEARLYPAQGVYGDTRLLPLDAGAENTPFITAFTTDEVVTNHNGIYNRKFLNFLRTFLLEMDRRSLLIRESSAAEAAEVERQGDPS